MTDELTTSREHAGLIRKLESIGRLTAEEKAAISRLSVERHTYAAGSDIARKKDRPAHCCLIVDGLAARYKITDDGERQIMSFHMRGDLPDLQAMHLHVLDHSLGAIVRTEGALIPLDEIRRLIAIRAWAPCCGATP